MDYYKNKPFNYHKNKERKSKKVIKTEDMDLESLI